MFYLSPYRNTRNPFGVLNNLMNSFDHDLFDQEALFQESALLNVYENEKTLTILLQSPGLKKEDIHVNCDGKSLLIEWEKKMEMEHNKASLEEIETEEKVRRQLTLPSYVNEETIKASYEDGVLCLVLEKKEKTAPKKIEVK